MMTVDVEPCDRLDYPRLVERVRALVRAKSPRGASVLVVSRGDNTLVDVAGWAMGHFPQSPTGLYAGHYPADGAAAVGHLTQLLGAGAQYLMVPATSMWWLDHYRELAMWLATEATVVTDEPQTGRLFRLVAARDSGPSTFSRERYRTTPQVVSLLRSVLPSGAGVVLIGLGAESVDLDDRPVWPVPPPRSDTNMSVDDVLAAVDAAGVQGGQYAALVIPEDPLACPDGHLRRELERRFRRVCAQRLVELFAVTSGEDADG